MRWSAGLARGVTRSGALSDEASDFAAGVGGWSGPEKVSIHFTTNPASGWVLLYAHYHLVWGEDIAGIIG